MSANIFWKILLVSSVFIIILGAYMLSSLDDRISGDGIPNNSQQYPWDQAIRIIVILSISAITAIYSLTKVFRLPIWSVK